MTVPRSRRRELLRSLLRSPEPSIRWRTRVHALGEDPGAPRLRRLRAEVRNSDRVRRLLREGFASHRPGTAGGIYRYWQGTHWALASLVDLGYPSRDPAVAPILDRAVRLWTAPRYDRTVRATAKSGPQPPNGVPLLHGRYRRCASQQGNALRYAVALGGPDPRADHLATLLRKWQWPDGGWNCARSPDARVSSFMESLTPMRGLQAYADRTGSKPAREAARRASEVFLERNLFRRRSNGRVMRPEFLRFHYPLYWHYDVLGGLKGIVEVGRIGDPRCREALEWLESRELARGGWPVDACYYRVSPEYRSGCEYVDWGRAAPRLRNDWVTTDALHVLAAAGRLDA